jgi:hypothetical protein
MKPMTRKSSSVVLAIAIVVSALAVPADAKTKHHKRLQPAPVADTPQRLGSQQPAHMIQVRPGYWVSSYGCVSDEGYGRYSPCDLTDGGGGR